MTLHVKVVEVVGVFGLSEVGTLQPMDDLSLHDPRDVGREQREEQAILKGFGGSDVKEEAEGKGPPAVIHVRNLKTRTRHRMK